MCYMHKVFDYFKQIKLASSLNYFKYCQSCYCYLYCTSGTLIAFKIYNGDPIYHKKICFSVFIKMRMQHLNSLSLIGQKNARVIL